MAIDIAWVFELAPKGTSVNIHFVLWIFGCCVHLLCLHASLSLRHGTSGAPWGTPHLAQTGLYLNVLQSKFHFNLENHSQKCAVPTQPCPAGYLQVPSTWLFYSFLLPFNRWPILRLIGSLFMLVFGLHFTDSAVILGNDQPNCGCYLHTVG